jgi:peptide/nickel transport system permease protein
VWGYVVRRLFWAVVLLLAVTAVTYIIFFVIPTDQNRFVRRTESGALDIRTALGIHGSVLSEYGQFVWNLAHGSLGHSYRQRREVSDIIGEAAPITASVVIGGAVMWLLISIPLGLISAFRPRSLMDRGAMVFVLIGISVHPVWLGLILTWFFGVKLHWFPVGGYCDVINPPPGTECGGPVQWVYHLVLPWFTFAALYTALYVRMIRASVAEALHEDYVRTARAKGASDARVLRKHVMRNALLPVTSMLGADIAIAMGGTLFVETVYGLPGLGRESLRALQTFDLPVILGVVVTVTTAVVVLNLIVDLLYAVLDPRVRVSRAPDEDVQPAVKPERARARPAAAPTTAR